MTTTPSPSRLTLNIDGMSCAHCVKAVTRALELTPGISVRSVSLGSAEVETASPASTAAALAAIEEAGYHAKSAEPAGRSTHSGCGCCCSTSSPAARCG